MKTLFIVFFCALSAPLFSQISIQWKTINLIEGYEYEGKIKVYIDDELVGESPVCWESKLCEYKIKVKGEHKIRIEQYANYKGNWEAKTIANDYSYDCVYENTFTFKKKQTLTVIWDTDSENIDVTLKK